MARALPQIFGDGFGALVGSPTLRRFHADESISRLIFFADPETPHKKVLESDALLSGSPQV